MTAPVIRFDDLEAQAERIMTVFRQAGYERVAPPFLQPAGVLLDRLGEDIRSRTYVFTDPDGQELCLRPDLTIPVARLHVEAGQMDAEARYSYNGPAFRYQPGIPNPFRPNEFRQAGIELYGSQNCVDADMEVLRLTASAVRDAGLQSMHLNIGDVSLFRALIQALAIPERWRARLIEAFWRTGAIPALLHKLEGQRHTISGELSTLLDRLHPHDIVQNAGILMDHLQAAAIEPAGQRSLEDIAWQLMALKADQSEARLSPATATTIRNYLSLSLPAGRAPDAIRALASTCGIALDAPAAQFEQRLARLSEAGFDAQNANFTAHLGARFEYYTGFVFEIAADDGGLPAPLASGGRYDGLLRAFGSPVPVPAVGAAIYTERLLAAARGRTA